MAFADVQACPASTDQSERQFDGEDDDIDSAVEKCVLTSCVKLQSGHLAMSADSQT